MAEAEAGRSPVAGSSAGGDVTAAGPRRSEPEPRDFVAVAVDLPGPAGLEPLTYHVPPELVDLEPGEAVLVEVGRRQVVGIVVGPAPVPDRETKPVRRRIRSDGPLLPPLTLALARFVSRHYLAPLATVIRAFLPPGLLDRVELVAELTARGADALRSEAGPPEGSEPAGGGAVPPHGSLGAEDRRLLEALAAGRRRVRSLAGADGRVSPIRRASPWPSSSGPPPSAGGGRSASPPSPG